MANSYASVGLAKDQPILRQRRKRKPVSAATLERLQKDFWKHFDLEKFARDWRVGVGTERSAA
jgi:hypothetical protein